MVNPDHIGLIDGDSVTTPDVLGVDVGDSNVPVGILVGKVLTLLRALVGYLLDDDVLGTADDTETLTLDDTAGALTDQSLVGGNGDTKDTGVVATISQYIK